MPAAALTKKESPPEKEVRVFFGEFTTYQNFLTAKGKVVQFFRGYLKSSDPEIVAYCETEIPGIQDVTGQIKLEEVPVAPVRSRQEGGWMSSNRASEPTSISPAELLQRAVANSSHVTNAASS